MKDFFMEYLLWLTCKKKIAIKKTKKNVFNFKDKRLIGKKKIYILQSSWTFLNKLMRGNSPFLITKKKSNFPMKNVVLVF